MSTDTDLVDAIVEDGRWVDNCPTHHGSYCSCKVRDLTGLPTLAAVIEDAVKWRKARILVARLGFDLDALMDATEGD